MSPPPPPKKKKEKEIEWMKFKDFIDPTLCHTRSRIHKISSTLAKVIGNGVEGRGPPPPLSIL